jgi:hypothetical protein
MQASTAKNETRLPRAVLRRSQAIEERLKAQREPNADPVDPAPPVDPSAVITDPVDPAPQPTPPAPPPPVADPRESDPAYWKQRFKVTEGVLRHERLERQTEAEGLNQRLTELQEQVRTLQASKPAAKPDIGKFFTPEQVEQLGEDQCEAIVAMAEKTVAAQVKDAIDAEIKPLKERQESEREQDLKARKVAFTDKLGELVPDYTEIDVDEGWLAWLAQDDDTTGWQRQAILDRHIQALNAPKVAKMFEAYRLTLPKTPAPPVAPHGKAAGPSGDPPAQPSRALTPASDAEVRDFHKRAALGKVKAAERVEFEARMKLRTGR